MFGQLLRGALANGRLDDLPEADRAEARKPGGGGGKER